MAASATLLGDADQGSCASVSDVIWDLDYPVGGAYNRPAAPGWFRRYPFATTLLDDNSPGMDGVELDSRLKQGQPGTVGVRVTGFAAEATLQATSQASIRQVLPRPVEFGRSIPSIEEVAGAP
jgi:CheY-like chemotaxis protein